ncbi:fructan 6-exohydrolase-like [Bidens hawaiensis]|uniref:fructan 6-exohydrolase-like n=1 Tax=Bidens hawaiensis TaxID=980011 RepID=UPI004049EF37
MASQNLMVRTTVFFRVFKSNHQFVALMCSDQRRSSLTQGINKTTYGAYVHMDREDEVISLRSLVDHSVVESFAAEGRAWITARAYLQFYEKEEAHIYVFNNGSRDIVIKTLDAWSMKRADGN